MKLRELLEGLTYECIQGSVDTEVEAVVSDSRKIKEHCLFSCIRGVPIVRFYGSAHFDSGIFRYSAVGKCIVKVVPLPRALSSSRRAWCIISPCFTMESPRPVPPTSLERLLSTR